MCENTHTHTHIVPLNKNPRVLFTFIAAERWLAPGLNLPPSKREAEEEGGSSLTQDDNVLDEAGALPVCDRSVIFLLSRSFLLYYSQVYFTVNGPVWFPQKLINTRRKALGKEMRRMLHFVALGA